MTTSASTKFSAPYMTHRFPAGLINRVGNLEFSPDDLAHALFVTGRAPGDRMSHGAASVWEYRHRTSMMPAYIRIGRKNSLVRSHLALELDRSEKVGLSYALGQAVTGIFCEKLLGVSHLLHVDRYSLRHNVRFTNTRKRADLFGLAHNGWIVAEAKGRSGAVEPELPGKLYEQKSSIISIAGQAPILALGCVASFPPDRQEMRIDAYDPEPTPIESVAIQVDLDRFMIAYYEPFLRALEVGAQTVQLNVPGDRTEYAAPARRQIGLLGVDVDILEPVEQLVRDAVSTGNISGVGESILSILAANRADLQFPDGSSFSADWDDALVVNDWQL